MSGIMFAVVARPLCGKGKFELLVWTCCDSVTCERSFRHLSGLMVAWLLCCEGGTQGSWLAQLWSHFLTGKVEFRGLSYLVAACLLHRDGGVQVLTEPSFCLTPAPEGWGLGCSPTPIAVWSLNRVEGTKMAQLTKLWLGYLQQWVITEGSPSLAIACVGTAQPPV